MVAVGRSTEPDAELTGTWSAPAVLELVDVDVWFGGVHALKRACLSASAGQIVGVCGDNGAGKSTVVNVLAGVHAHSSYAGDVVLDGKIQRLRCPADARRAGIAVVHDNGNLVPQLSVAHNLMLGCEPRWFGLVDEARLETEAGRLLEHHALSDRVRPGDLVGELATGLQQMLAVVRALSQRARVLVLDEPARTLAPAERDALFAWLRALDLRGAAATCVYVAHRMEELIGLCDRVAVLRDGETAQSLSGPPGRDARANARYVVRDEIAAGGMATVHLGRIRGPFGFASTVAIKRLHPQLAKNPEFVAMFIDEARLASRVRHPNVVPVLDVFADDGALSLVMEYVDGESLAHLCRLAAGDDIPVPIAVAIVASILHGLHAAHEARDERGRSLDLVHRDVSPQNVIVGADGRARIIDFGIAKAAGRHTASRNRQLKGKIAYMAPEQLRRGDVSRRTDVYGAAVLLWELLVGEQLFDGDSEGMIIGRVLDDVVPAPSSLRCDLPIELDAIALRGLARAPEARFESARDMAHALEQVVPPATAERVGAWLLDLAGGPLTARRAKVRQLERESVARPVPPPGTRVHTADAPPRRSGFADLVRRAFRRRS